MKQDVIQGMDKYLKKFIGLSRCNIQDNALTTVTHDDKGNRIYCEKEKKLNEWFEYNDDNKVTHYKNSDDYEEWYEYDNENNLIQYKDSNNWEIEYNKSGKAIYSKDSNNRETWFKYDTDNKCIYARIREFNSDTIEEFWYDANDNLIREKKDGKEMWYEYDKGRNCTMVKYDNGLEIHFGYNDLGNMTDVKVRNDSECIDRDIKDIINTIQISTPLVNKLFVNTLCKRIRNAVDD